MVKPARPEWAKARRIVVKIGSALLTDRATGRIKSEWLNSFMDDVAELARAGKDVVLVSSGSIALGRHALKLPKGPLELEQSQAAASVGQISLAHAYQELAAARGLTAAPAVAVEHTRDIGKSSMIHNTATPRIEVDPETFDVTVDGQLATCEPAKSLPMAQKYFLF